MPTRITFARWIPLSHVGIVLAVAAFILATGSREPPTGEAARVWDTAWALIERGDRGERNELARRVPETHGDSLPTVEHPVLNALVHLPGAVLLRLGQLVWPDGADVCLILASHLAPAMIAGLIVVALFELALLLAVRRTVAWAAALLGVFTTILWVYARSPLPHILHAWLFLRAYLALCRILLGKHASPLSLGIWLACLINAAWMFVLAVPAFIGLALWRAPHRRRATLVLAAAIAVGLGLATLEASVRTGRSFAWLTDLFAPPMRQSLVLGLWGLFLSPGKSLFLYSMPLVLCVTGARKMVWRDHGRVLVAAMFVLAPCFVYLAKHPFWAGDWAWGPRLVVFATPILFLPVAVLLDELVIAWPGLSRWARAKRLFWPAGVFALGLFVQLAGVVLHPDHFIRIAREARLHWLGTPVRTAAFAPDQGGRCDPCFEDMYVTVWLPPFQPIGGHVWLARHLLAGHDADTATADGAWRRQTSLMLDIKDSYARARFDWWLLDFFPGRPVLGGSFLLCWSGLFVLGLGLWRRTERTRESEGAS